MSEGRRKESWDDKQCLLQQAVVESIFIPYLPEKQRNNLNICKFTPDLLDLREKLNVAFKIFDSSQIFPRRLIQHYIDMCIPISPSKIYFEILNMTTEEQHQFLNQYFSHYESIYNELTFIDGYQQISLDNRKICAELLNFELQKIVKQNSERLRTYQYFLKLNYDISGEDLTKVLKDIIRMGEYELFIAYVKNFHQSTYRNDSNLYFSTLLDEACSARSIQIVKYLIESMKVEYHHHFVIPYKKLPIVQSIASEYSTQCKYQHYHPENMLVEINRRDQNDIEIQKQQSLQIVQYLIEIYKRDDRINEFIEAVSINYDERHYELVNDIVGAAYEFANIPVLLYLKQLSFDIIGGYGFLSRAVKSSNVETVKLYFSEYNFQSKYDAIFLNEVCKQALEVAVHLESLEVLFTLHDLGVDFAKYSEIILGAARLELLSCGESGGVDFSNPLTENSFYFGILNRIIESKYFSLAYLEALCSCDPHFYAFFECHFADFITSIFNRGVYFYLFRVEEKFKIFKNLLLIPKFFPLICKPCLCFWTSTFLSTKLISEGTA